MTDALNQRAPLVSVIVPTRNNCTTVRRLIDSVLTQCAREGLELLVVDGQSEDGTQRVAAEAGAMIVSYPCTGDMRGYARNLGASLSRGKILLFLDSDMELTQGVIEDCVRIIARGANCVIIPELNVGSGILGKVRSWERDIVQSQIELTFARALDRDFFESLGGFDERILGFEDLDLQATLLERGAQVGMSRAKIIHHEEGLTLGAYLRKRRYYRRTAAILTQKHPGIRGTLFSPLGRLKLYASNLEGLTSWPLFLIAVFLRICESV